MKPVRIVILAKAPLPGFAKTRLIPALGEQGAAHLAERLIRHTVESALAANIGSVELCVTPDQHHACWQAMQLPEGLCLSEQVTGDLGQRMGEIAARVVAGGESVLLIGTDCPALDAAQLRRAAAALAKHEAVMIPAHDGGYVLLGLKQYHPRLFADIPWSTAQVAALTQQRLSQLQWGVEVLPALHDVDMPQDLPHLPLGWLSVDA